jgi:hypothetical protein
VALQPTEKIHEPIGSVEHAAAVHHPIPLLTPFSMSHFVCTAAAKLDELSNGGMTLRHLLFDPLFLFSLFGQSPKGFASL